ncbi:hypothetical protein J6590_107456, partial [Homalodisca vitripennis]
SLHGRARPGRPAPCHGQLTGHRARAPHAVEEWGDQGRRRERVGMEGPLLPTTDSPCIRIVE